ncbi:MAG: SAM-dependent methyltransferase [Myxococcales bacterium]|nr:SAM-dependent methyltransferase [Myxococcales bacterium]
MRDDKPSTTAAIVALGRALYADAPEDFGPTGDEHTEALLSPAMRAFVRLAKPLWSVAPKLARGAFRVATFGMSEHVALRTRCIDDAIERAVREGCTQLVTLGAGLDTRPWRMSALASVTAWEVDHPATQKYKRARAEVRPSRCKDLRFVSVDFTKDSLAESLARAGHDASQRTAWVLEGVSVYLARAALEETLDAVRDRSALGSTLAFTYVPRAVVTRWSQGQKSIDAVTRAIGERFEGLLEREDARDLLEARGFELVSDEGTAEMASRLMPGIDPAGVWERERVAISQWTDRSR